MSEGDPSNQPMTPPAAGGYGNCDGYDECVTHHALIDRLRAELAAAEERADALPLACAEVNRLRAERDATRAELAARGAFSDALLGERDAAIARVRERALVASQLEKYLNADDVLRDLERRARTGNPGPHTVALTAGQFDDMNAMIDRLRATLDRVSDLCETDYSPYGDHHADARGWHEAMDRVRAVLDEGGHRS